MKNCLLLLSAIFLVAQGFSQTYEPVDNTAFSEGEELTFRVYYHSTLTGNLTAGMAYLKVLPTDTTFDDREVHRITGYGRTKGIINWFFKVREHFQSFVDKEALVPHFFTRDTRENNYKKKDEVVFDYEKMQARSWYDTTAINGKIQDIISAFYYARNFDFDTIGMDDNYYVDYFIDDSVYHSAIEFVGFKTIETDYGTFRCLGFKPKVAVGQVFKEPYPGVLWVTDDKNHLPLLAESEVWIGEVKLELVEAKGIRNRETARTESVEITYDKERSR